MNLTNLVRSIGALAVIWTLVAMGIGASGARLPGPPVSESLVCESPPVDAMPTGGPRSDQFELVDRTNGRRSPLRLPEGHRWSMVGVSPWRGPRGELEAVGRWVSQGEQDFCGWGLFRLSDGALLCRVATEILPVGRACWIPGHERTILFPAGDGQLYRCRLDPGAEKPVGRGRTYASGRAEPSIPLVWGTTPPGSAEVFLEDPVWPDVSGLKDLVFVALRQQESRKGRLKYGPSRLWWLQIDDDAGTIVAAGPLTASSGGDRPSVDVDERFPNAAIGAGGARQLVYLEREPREANWRPRRATLEVDTATSRPRLVASTGLPGAGPAGELLAVPLMVSADGSTAYGLSRSGEIAALSLAARP